MLMGLTHLFMISQVLPCLSATRGATTMMVGPSSSSPEGMEPHPRRLALVLSCGCPLSMCLDPFVAYVAPASPVYIPKHNK
jgi:hypothetical protein